LGDLLHQEEEYCAYVLIKVRTGKDLDVFLKVRELAKKYPIREVAMVYGDYDIVSSIRLQRPGDLQQFVYEGLRAIEGVEETTTLIAGKCVEFNRR